MEEKRGVFFSIDAIIALMIIFIIILVAFPILKTTNYETELHYDVLSALSALKVGEIDNTYVQSLISQGLITDMNNSILEQIGEFYITNLTLAKELGNEVLQNLDTNENIGIWYEGILIASKNSTPFELAEDIDTSRQIISGIGGQGNGSVTGFSARAFLANGLRSQYYYFGGYVGDGNLSVDINYNGNITSAEMELVINKDFELVINGNSNGTLNGSIDEYTPVKHILPINDFISGSNTVEFKGDYLHIAGGYIKITYQSDVEYAQLDQYYFPGVDGLINLYDGISIPGTLNEMLISLHLDSDNISAFLNIGNTTIYNGSTGGEQTVVLDNSQLSSLLDYSALSNKTTPIRLGLSNVSFVRNETFDAHVFSVTDLSGSMRCSISGYYWSQYWCEYFGGVWMGPIDNAKLANKAFIDAILNVSYLHNLVGLVGYDAIARDEDFHPLSNDSVSLHSKVDSWTEGGSTCICCGINKAVTGMMHYLFSSANIGSGSLLAYYNLDNNVNDSSGNGYNGTISGNPSYVGGVASNALSFDGNGDWVNIPDIVNSSEGSIAFWFKTPEMRRKTIFDASSPNRDFFIDIDDKRDLRFQFEDSSGNRYRAKSRVSGVSTGVWHHIVGIWRFDSSPAVEIYLDNSLLDDDTGTPSGMDDYYSPRIGAPQSSSTTQWDFEGEIDDFRIYSKALNATEINGLYTQVGTCGNNLTETGEVCDGEVQACFSGGWGTQSCNSQCDGFLSCNVTGPVCGDGIVDATEECDDGNTANNDGCDSNCTVEDKLRSILVMSDGQANRECIEQGTGSAAQDAIQAACDAYNNYNISVHSIAFGSSADESTLQQIATCGNGVYYGVANISQVVEIYQQVAQEVITATYVEQTIEITGDVFTKLYPDSYIELNYTKDNIPFGLILTSENQFSDNNSGSFDIPSESSIIDARAVSYSGSRWTDNVLLNSNNIYNISSYGDEYIPLGDPYSFILPKSLISNTSTNFVNISTGISPDTTYEGSGFNKIIYTVLKNALTFSPVSVVAYGCNWEIQFEDDTSITQTIPSEYSGTDNCYYNATYDGVGDDDGFVMNVGDAFQISVLNLLRELDLDSNGKVDVKFTEQDLQIDLTSIVGIPFTWSTEVQVRVWNS